MFMNCSGSKRGNRVLESLTFKGVQHPEEADPSPRRVMEVMCSIPERSVLSVTVLTGESADRALMPVSVVVRVSIWLEIDHRTEVRMEVMLSLGLIHRVRQQPSLLKGTSSIP